MEAGGGICCVFETGLQTSLGYRNRPRLKLALRMPFGTEDCRGGGGDRRREGASKASPGHEGEA